jgi:hypothetical protein
MKHLKKTIHVQRSQIVVSIILLATSFTWTIVAAQPLLPSPSRTIYKCVVKGAVSYSDEPCPGAQRLDATPNRGIDRLSGKSRIGNDVAREANSERFATVVRPLTGMDPARFATASRRNNMTPDVRRDCNQLEPAILELEQAEKRTDAAALNSVQQNLFVLRKRYKTLGC